MRTCDESLDDWRSRLAQLEVQIARTERTGEINWHLRIKARVLQYLLARYSDRAWEPTPPLLTTTPPRTLCPWLAVDGRLDQDQGDVGAFVRAAVGETEPATASPELTWSEVCYCLLPWDEPRLPPGSEKFENRPRPPEVIADHLHKLHALNTTPRRSWFHWEW